MFLWRPAMTSVRMLSSFNCLHPTPKILASTCLDSSCSLGRTVAHRFNLNFSSASVAAALQTRPAPPLTRANSESLTSECGFSHTAATLSTTPSTSSLTAFVPRFGPTVSAHITRISSLSSSVKQFDLAIQHPSVALIPNLTPLRPVPPALSLAGGAVDSQPFSFLAGQWVDLHLPHLPRTVPSFSICSSPAQLIEKRMLQIAVKKTRFPPARWLHDVAKENDRVFLQVGGLFAYHSAEQMPQIAANSAHSSSATLAESLDDNDRHAVFICGGVGITPLMSIVRFRAWLTEQRRKTTANFSEPSTILIHSCRTSEDFIFENELNDLNFSFVGADFPQSFTQFSRQAFYTITDRQHLENTPTARAALTLSGRAHRHVGRINDNLLTQIFSRLHGSPLEPQRGVRVYLCGPPNFLDGILKVLRQEKYRLQKDDIRFEKWW